MHVGGQWVRDGMAVWNVVYILGKWFVLIFVSSYQFDTTSDVSVSWKRVDWGERNTYELPGGTTGVV